MKLVYYDELVKQKIIDSHDVDVITKVLLDKNAVVEDLNAKAIISLLPI